MPFPPQLNFLFNSMRQLHVILDVIHLMHGSYITLNTLNFNHTVNGVPTAPAVTYLQNLRTYTDHTEWLYLCIGVLQCFWELFLVVLSVSDTCHVFWPSSVSVTKSKLQYVEVDLKILVESLLKMQLSTNIAMTVWEFAYSSNLTTEQISRQNRAIHFIDGLQVQW